MAFELISSRPAPELNGVLHTYRHPTGLVHHHLATPDTERSFALAFPTHPTTDQGQAHVLEHVVLCGSKKYPVRDPFMAMTQRSLASFMNAMTYADRTVYPFATSDAADFENLLAVYLDATFSPLLRPLDFQQEGIRYALDDQGKLRLEGVVFNEMKGALASRERITYDAVKKALFPNTTYAVDSGGIPAAIRTLDYESLVAFHRHYYHPAHATALTHGDVDITMVHRHLEAAIEGWQAIAAPDALPNSAFASTLQAPVRVEARVPGEGTEEGQSLVWAWAHGPSFENNEGLIAQFVLQALAGNDAAPLTQAMSEQDYGRPGSLLMAQDDEKHASVWLSMDGLAKATLPLAEGLIREVLQDVAEHGLPAEHLEAIFGEFELQRRERGGPNSPVGIELLLDMAPAALAGAELLETVDPAHLMAMKPQLTDPTFVATWVRENLLNNPRQVLLTAVPDPKWFERLAEEEAGYIAPLEAALSPQERDAILANQEMLAHFQSNPPSPECLPCVDLATVSREPQPPLPHTLCPASKESAARLHVEAHTPGLVQVDITLDMTGLSPSSWSIASVCLSMLDSIGCNGRDWQDAAAWRSQGTVALETSHAALLMRQENERWLPLFQLAGKALTRRSDDLAQVVYQTLFHPDFSDHERLSFLVNSDLEELMDAVSREANSWAMQEATAPIQALAAWKRATDGRPAIETLQYLQSMLEEEPEAAQQWLENQWKRVLSLPCLVVSMGGKDAQAVGEQLAQLASGATPWPTQSTSLPLHWDPEARAADLLLKGPTPLNYCHQAWAGPLASDPDAPAMELLAKALQHGFLLSAIREKGSAYGAYARLRDGTFTMSSYRDPRLLETFADFQAAATWACTTPLTEQALKEAKISALTQMTSSMTPMQHAQVSVATFLTGTTLEQRRIFRGKLLDATAEDIQGVAQRWLANKPGIRAVFGNGSVVPDGFVAVEALTSSNEESSEDAA